jgi:GntR family transcriptional regulator
MNIRLDPRSGEPIYQQIVERVKYLVARGDLKPGEQLPSIRTLAADLDVNPRTVVKAYETLQASGLVVMQQGQGVFVTEARGSVSAVARRKALADMARRLLAEASRLGAGTDETLGVIRDVARDMEKHT